MAVLSLRCAASVLTSNPLLQQFAPERRNEQRMNLPKGALIPAALHAGECARCLGIALRLANASRAVSMARAELHYAEIERREHMRYESPAPPEPHNHADTGIDICDDCEPKFKAEAAPPSLAD
jgi:hypothetical protein